MSSIMFDYFGWCNKITFCCILHSQLVQTVTPTSGMWGPQCCWGEYRLRYQPALRVTLWLCSQGAGVVHRAMPHSSWQSEIALNSTDNTGMFVHSCCFNRVQNLGACLSMVSSLETCILKLVYFVQLIEELMLKRISVYRLRNNLVHT